MKLLHLSFEFQYCEALEEILENHRIENYVAHPMINGRDPGGKHTGSQVFPGNMTVIQAQVPEDKLDALFADLEAFRNRRKKHQHIQGLVLPVEKRL